ncbi:sulfur carrier protein ThiS [Chloroflexota bacterium]
MLITISGDETEIPDGYSIKQLIRLKDAPDNVVVVLNGDIVDAKLWESATLNANDEVELIQFVAGG